MRYTYGYLTWEWRRDQLRSIAHPILFVAVYKLLVFLRIDQVDEFIIYGPRILQALIAAFGDLYTYKLARRIFREDRVANLALFCSLVSWFNFYCSVRMLSNSVETVLTTVALYYWPWPSFATKDTSWKERSSMLRISLSIAALACILRPTNAALEFNHLQYNLNNVSMISNLFFFQFLFSNNRPISIISAVFVPFNFFRVNVFQSISLFYGTHPWHWYFTQGIPAIAASFLPFVTKGIISSESHAPRAKPFVSLMLWVIIGYSFLGHKEFRFIYPILPIAIIFSGFGLAEIARTEQSQNSIHRHYFKASIVFLIITQIPLAYYTSFTHQRGVIDVINYLRIGVKQGKVRDIGFLMPCHSTPFYSNMHQNVTMWFLTCEPPVSDTTDINESSLDEATIFYADPQQYLTNRFEPLTNKQESNNGVSNNIISMNSSREKWPSHLVIFQALLKDLEPFIDKAQYHQRWDLPELGFNFKEDVSTQSQVKSSVQRNIRSKILDQYKQLESVVDEVLPKKTPLVLIKCHEHINLLTMNNEILFFQHFDGPYYPTLRLLHKYPDAFPRVQVDRGAIKFILSGANIMCPGLTSKGAKIEQELPADTIVGVFAEGKEHAIAIGLMKLSTEEIKKVNKGIGVDNIHYLNDPLWKTIVEV
ncbi:9531_t:CDS:10 [Ambispora leptoticha]|uniref:Mannosyltransferase n=1 Tax=Ambispora leptoticha TaxID=144679 RepID=A0A9N9ALN8_9GLOM|nr:9531_t:CDS:10 [Ambispora leptoticha]